MDNIYFNFIDYSTRIYVLDWYINSSSGVISATTIIVYVHTSWEITYKLLDCATGFAN